jgi:hypothetical protein
MYMCINVRDLTFLEARVVHCQLRLELAYLTSVCVCVYVCINGQDLRFFAARDVDLSCGLNWHT